MAPGRDHRPETLPEPTEGEAGVPSLCPAMAALCVPKGAQRHQDTCLALLNASLEVMEFSVPLQPGCGGFAFYFVLSFESVDLVQLRPSGLSFS